MINLDYKKIERKRMSSLTYLRNETPKFAAAEGSVASYLAFEYLQNNDFKDYKTRRFSFNIFFLFFTFS